MARNISLRFSLGAAFSLTVFFTSLVLGAVTYLTIRNDARQNLRNELGHFAGAAALWVEADDHGKLQSEADQNSAYYQRIRSVFRQILKMNPDLRFVYTFRLNSPGKAVFVVDSGDEGPDFSPLGSPVETMSPVMASVFKQPAGVRIESDFTTDKWGTWLSGYAPIIKSDGGIEGALGMDIAANHVIELENKYLFLIGSITLAIAIAGMIGGLWLSRRITKPLLALATDMQRIQTLVLDDVRVQSNIKEVIDMNSAVDNMKRGLRSFKKYVPADVVTRLMKMNKEAVLETTKTNITVFFSDLESFTSVSEKVGVERISAMLGVYFDVMTGTLEDQNATVDKYIGDSIMAFWGAPEPDQDHAYRACRAALACRQALDRLHERWKAEGIPTMNTRIGLNTGEAVVGNIGYADRLSYTALGDTVNLASRLESLNKYYGTYLLVGENTMQEVRGRIGARLVDRVAVKGKTRPIGIYELLSDGPKIPDPLNKAVNTYHEALEAYFTQNWDEAERQFKVVLGLKPEDGPSLLMLKRCAALRASPPAKDWDGVTVMQDK